MEMKMYILFERNIMYNVYSKLTQHRVYEKLKYFQNNMPLISKLPKYVITKQWRKLRGDREQKLSKATCSAPYTQFLPKTVKQVFLQCSAQKLACFKQSQKSGTTLNKTIYSLYFEVNFRPYQKSHHVVCSTAK